MVLSSRKAAPRPDLKLYRPDKGLENKGSECSTVTKGNKEATPARILKDINCSLDHLSKRAKRKRPDRKVYAPKPSFYASRVNEKSVASGNNLPIRVEKSKMPLKDSSSFDEMQSPEVSNSLPLDWGDLADLQEKISRQVSIIGVDKVFGNSTALSTNVLDPPPQNCAASSGYSSSSEGKVDFATPRMEKKKRDREFFENFRRQSPWDEDYDPTLPSESDIIRFIKAREEVVEEQVAFFDKLVAGSSKNGMVKKLLIPKKSKSEKLSAQTVTFQKPITPAVNNRGPSDLKNKAAPFPLGRKNGVNTNQFLTDFPDIIIPACTKIDHRFCAPDYWGSRNSTFLDASAYIPPPQPIAKSV